MVKDKKTEKEKGKEKKEGSSKQLSCRAYSRIVPYCNSAILDAYYESTMEINSLTLSPFHVQIDMNKDSIRNSRIMVANTHRCSSGFSLVNYLLNDTELSIKSNVGDTVTDWLGVVNQCQRIEQSFIGLLYTIIV